MSRQSTGARKPRRVELTEPCHHSYIGPSGVRHECYETKPHTWHRCRDQVTWQDQHENNP